MFLILANEWKQQKGNDKNQMILCIEFDCLWSCKLIAECAVLENYAVNLLTEKFKLYT